MKISDEQLAALEAMAKAATPGPWESYPNIRSRWDRQKEEYAEEEYIAGYNVKDRDGEDVIGIEGIIDSDSTNADYIAAANPAVVLALIARLREAREEMWEARGIAGQALQNADTAYRRGQEDMREAAAQALHVRADDWREAKTESVSEKRENTAYAMESSACAYTIRAMPIKEAGDE